MPFPVTRQHMIGAATAASILTSAAAFIAPWEGFYPKPYYDIVGVKTVCYGATAAEHVDLNRTYTKAECEKMLADGLPKYYYAWVACVKGDRVLPVNMQIAFTSLAYNIGSSAVCHSTALRKASAGDYKGACNAIMLYNKGHKGGGPLVVIKGLDNRRKAEQAVCLKGL